MIGKYVLSRNYLNGYYGLYFDHTYRDSSSKNFYYWVEEVAKASEAWDIVEYARTDTENLWCMLVSKNSDKLGYYTVIEFYDYNADYIGVSHYIYVTESLRNSIFTAGSRSDLEELGFVRNDTSGQIKDLGVINTSDMNLSTVLSKVTLNVAYIGPDVIVVGDESKDVNLNNNFTINLMFFERNYFPGNLICLKSAQTFPVFGDNKWRGVGNTGVSTSVASEMILTATHNVSLDYRHQEYIPSIYYIFEISPKFDDYYWDRAYFTPYIAFYDGFSYEIFKYTWKIYSNDLHEKILDDGYYLLTSDALRYTFNSYPAELNLYSKVDSVIDYIEEEPGGDEGGGDEIPS